MTEIKDENDINYGSSTIHEETLDPQSQPIVTTFKDSIQVHYAR